MHCHHLQLDGNKPNSIVVVFLLLSLFTIVLADPQLGEELNNELLDLRVSAMLSDERNWRKDNSDDKDWRKSDNVNDTNVRWGAISIYEDSNKLPPGYTPTETELETAVDSRKPASQFKLTF